MKFVLRPGQHVEHVGLRDRVLLRTLAGEGRHLQAGPLRQCFESVSELDLVEFHDPSETIAASAARPTTKRLPVGIHDQRRTVIVMKRTEAFELGPASARRQGDRLTDQRDKVGARANQFPEVIVGEV